MLFVLVWWQVSMNFLAHLYLSGKDPAILSGNFMGDFVKGVIGDEFPPKLKSGMLLHRRIDSFVHGHALSRRSRLRLDPRYGLYRGVMLDLFYDHFLVVDWAIFSDDDLTSFLSRSRKLVEEFRPWMPRRLVDLIPVVYEQLFPSYATVEGVGDALRRMSGRIRRDNPLKGSERELILHYEDLRRDFREFLPILKVYADQEISAFDALQQRAD